MAEGGRWAAGQDAERQVNPHHRHVHLQLDINVSARQIGIFAVVAMSLFYCIVCVLWLWPPRTRLCPARTAHQGRQQQSHGLLQFSPERLALATLCHTIPYQYQCQRAVHYRHYILLVVSPPPPHLREGREEALPLPLAGGLLKGDEVASLIDCDDERCLRTRRRPTRQTRPSKISKGDVGTVLGACDDESKSDKADRVYVDLGEGKGRADFVKSELRLVNRVLVGTYTGDLSEQLTVFLPRRRMSELEISDVVGAILVLGFVSVWTHTAASQDAPFLFVLFSAPFWYTGIYINMMFFLYKII